MQGTIDLENCWTWYAGGVGCYVLPHYDICSWREQASAQACLQNLVQMKVRASVRPDPQTLDKPVRIGADGGRGLGVVGITQE